MKFRLNLFGHCKSSFKRFDPRTWKGQHLLPNPIGLEKVEATEGLSGQFPRAVESQPHCCGSEVTYRPD